MTLIKKRISKRIDNSFVVWFKERNQWVQLEEPAYYIYKLFSRGISASEITLRFKKRYGFSGSEADPFLSELITRFTQFSETPGETPSEEPFQESIINYSLTPFSSHSYRFRNKYLAIDYQTKLHGYYIHPLFAHLEVKPDHPPLKHFEIFSSGQSEVLRVRDSPGKFWTFKDINSLKRKLFIEIINFLYDKTDDDWMAYIHSSAITDRVQTILMPSVSGSGKSTLVSLLNGRGLQFVSDDFTALDARKKNAYPFPASISVKKGAFKLLSSLDLYDLDYHSLSNSGVKYLAPQIDNSWYKPYPVRKIVFIRFNEKIPFRFEKIPVLKALTKFLEQARVSTNDSNAGKFINWFAELDCYILEFSDTKKAVE